MVKHVDGCQMILCCEVEIAPLPITSKAAGWMLGITFFVIMPDGQVVVNPNNCTDTSTSSIVPKHGSCAAQTTTVFQAQARMPSLGHK